MAEEIKSTTTQGEAVDPASALLECDDCHQKKPDVKETHCPYSEEINGTIIECQLCGACYHERCMDI